MDDATPIAAILGIVLSMPELIVARVRHFRVDVSPGYVPFGVAFDIWLPDGEGRVHRLE